MHDGVGACNEAVKFSSPTSLEAFHVRFDFYQEFLNLLIVFNQFLNCINHFTNPFMINVQFDLNWPTETEKAFHFFHGS